MAWDLFIYCCLDHLSPEGTIGESISFGEKGSICLYVLDVKFLYSLFVKEKNLFRRKRICKTAHEKIGFSIFFFFLVFFFLRWLLG